MSILDLMNKTANFNINFKLGGKNNLIISLPSMEDIMQVWKEGGAIKAFPQNFRNWFTLVNGSESPTHYIEATFTIRLDNEGNPLPIQRNAPDAAEHNDCLRNGAKTNPYLEQNNLCICGKSGLASEVLIAPHKANVVEIALDEDGDIVQVEDGDHAFLVYSKGNSNTDIIGKLDTTHNAESGKFQQGQLEERKMLRELLLKGATKEVVEHYDFIAEGQSSWNDEEGYDCIQAEDFNYCGQPLKDIVDPEFFALVVVQGVGTLKKAHKAEGNRNPYRRFEFSWASSWVLPNLTKGGNKPAPKGNKLKYGIKFPEEDKSSFTNSSSKRTQSNSSSSKDILKDVQWNHREMVLLMNEDNTVEETLLNGNPVSEKGWYFEEEEDKFVIIGKEDKVIFFLKKGEVLSTAYKFLAEHKAYKSEGDIFLSDERKVLFYYGSVEEEYVSSEPESEDDGLEGEKIDLDLNLDCNTLRQQALQFFEKRLNKEPDTIPKEPSFMFEYFYAINTAFSVMNESLEESYDIPSHKTEEGHYVLNELVDADCARVNVPLAIAAWLTTDGWRAHKEYEGIPEDLSYGLVTQYPVPLLKLANQFLHPTSSYSFKIDKESMELCKKASLERVKKSFPNLTQDKLEKIVPPHISLGEIHRS